jgi:hypothetical protein
MKRRLLIPSDRVHRHDEVRVGVADKYYRAFPVTNGDCVPEAFFRSLKAARSYVALSEVPDVLYKIRAECSEDEDPMVQLRKIRAMCDQTLTELNFARRSQTYAMTNKSVADIQNEKEEENKQYWRDLKAGRGWL